MFRFRYLLLALLFPCVAWGSCSSGGSHIWNAATANGSDIVACLNSASTYGATTGGNGSFVSGDTINVPSGTVTWSSLLHITGVKVKLVGATTCTGCAAGSGAAGTFTDNTVVTLGVSGGTSFQCTANESQGDLNFCDISGFTFKLTSNAAVTAGNINLGCASAGGRGTAVAFRFHHNHIIFPAGTSNYSGIVETNCWGGLNDHLLIEDQNTTGQSAVPFNFFGWFNDQGYTAWHEATQLGTANAFYTEDSTYTTTQQNTEGFKDCYEGAKVVLRYSSISGEEYGEAHGTDSGGYRSCVVNEVYNVTFSNSGSSMEILNSRGGVTMFFNNPISGNFGGLNLNDYRNAPITTGQGPEFGNFGAAETGLNWQPVSATPTSNNTLGPGPSWASSHTYAANAAITTGSCNLWTSAGGVSSSGSAPTCPSTGGTVVDGTVTWTNVGGSTSAGVGVAGWSATHPDTIDAVAGTRYFDNNGGTCPFRDQPGVGHDQVYMPDYEWGNTSGHTWSNANGASCIVANTAYYSFNASFTGASGVGSGLLSARPATCTTQVAYWATDTSTLYQCSSTNTWTTYYTPYTYPHPLQGSAPVLNLTPNPLAFGNQANGVTSSAQTVTVNNTGTATETLSGITIGGTNPSDFANIAGGSCNLSSGTIAAGGSCTLFFTFTPGALGARSATLTVNGTVNSPAISLTGTGVTPPPPPAPAPQMIVSYPGPNIISVAVRNCPNSCQVTLTCSTNCAPTYTGVIQ